MEVEEYEDTDVKQEQCLTYELVPFLKTKKEVRTVYLVFFNVSIYHTGLPKYYALLQTVAARCLGLPACRLAGSHSDAAPKHSLCYFSCFRVDDGHAHRRTFAKRRR